VGLEDRFVGGQSTKPAAQHQRRREHKGKAVDYENKVRKLNDLGERDYNRSHPKPDSN
jgi:hypothetical protein